MFWKALCFVLLTVLLAMFFPLRLRPQEEELAAVRPAKVVRIRNLELNAEKSNRPAYLPAEWGRLVSVQSIGGGSYWLFLQAESGDIYLVRLTQRGNYLYVDTSDQGGVALVIPRRP